MQLKAWAKQGWELLRVQTLALVWPETPRLSKQLSSTLMHSHRIWTCANFSWESSTTLALIWSEAMIVDESWKKTLMTGNSPSSDPGTVGGGEGKWLGKKLAKKSRRERKERSLLLFFANFFPAISTFPRSLGLRGCQLTWRNSYPRLAWP